jgi:hypothetical protein
MDAKQVYEQQEALRQAENVLNELAIEESYAQRNGAPVASGDYLRSPQGRAVEALRAEVKLAQDEVGGVVYLVHEEHIDRVEHKVGLLAKRAAKVGGEFEYKRAMEDAVEAAFGQVSIWHYVTLKAPKIKLAGWSLLAKLTVEEAGVMIGTLPGIEVSLAEYATVERATACDYCGKARKRTATFVVEHETGERKVVGSNCLRDFLGTDPHASLRFFQMLGDLEVELRSGGSGTKSFWATAHYLAHAACMIRLSGWAPKSSSEYPTATQAANNMRAQASKSHDKRGKPLWDDQSDADHARAREALKWADEVLGAKVNQTGDASDFDRNLYIAAKNTYVTDRTEGTLAYLPVAHAKAQEREIEYRLRNEKNAAAGATSTHVGQAKDRITVTGTVASVYENEGDWGTTFITKIEGDDGNIYKWFGSYDLGRGNKITGKFTVKKHDEYQGVKETVITRPSGIEVLEADGEPVPFAVNDEVVVTESGRAGKVTQVNLKFKTVVVEYSGDEAPALVRWEDATAKPVLADEGLQVPASHR